MPIDYYPHCGRVFACTDTIGITDIRKARSAFAFALTYGQQQVNAFSRAWNMRAGSFRDPNFDVMFEEPLCGFSNEVPFVRQSAPYVTRMPLELVDSYDRVAITIGFRFASIGEVQTWGTPTLGNGQGARGQKITVNLDNLANSLTSQVVDIFYDRNWYLTNIPGAVSIGNWIDLSTSIPTTSPGLSISQTLEQFGHNVITLIHTIPASVRQVSRATAGSLRLSYEFPRNPNGGAWTGTQPVQPSLEIRNHPLSGAPMSFVGINEAEVRLFRSDAWTVGTAPVTATRSRGYAITPIPAFPSMGDVYTAGVQNSLTAYANSLKSIGWVAFNSVGAQRGGYVRPLVGFSDRFDEQAQTMTSYGEIPEGATQFMALAYIKLDNAGGRVETVRLRINADGFDTLATMNTTTFGTTSSDWWYVTGNLSAFSQPTNGQVNRCSVILEVEKTIYGTRNLGSLYWDGIHSVLLKFF